MKRPLLAVSLAATMATTGCSAAPRPTHSEAHAMVSPSETGTPIHIPELPNDLPPSIREAARAAVGISVGPVANEGSGVRLDNRIVITAGHVVLQENGGGFKSLSSCTSLQAISADGPNGARSPYQRVAGTYADNLDLAGFTLSPIGNTLPPTDRVQVSTTAPKAGEVVYFVNFEPTADRTPRQPNSAGAYGQPAIYAGVIAPPSPYDHTNGQIRVITGLKSYGVVPDENTRPGASGGAVFEVVNGRAVLEGISVRADLRTSTVQDFSQNNDLAITGLPPDYANLGLTEVQPVTAQNIAALGQQIDAAKPCTFGN